MIYFAQALSGGKIKIGRSADPDKRVSDLSTASPEPLKLLATIDANDAVETLLHRALNGPDSHREWHCSKPALEGLLEACEAGINLGPLLDALLEVPSIKRATEQRKPRVKKPPRLPVQKRSMKLSKAERKRRSDAIKKAHAEGKIGGQKYGRLGGRPKGS